MRKIGEDTFDMITRNDAVGPYDGDDGDEDPKYQNKSVQKLGIALVSHSLVLQYVRTIPRVSQHEQTRLILRRWQPLCFGQRDVLKASFGSGAVEVIQVNASDLSLSEQSVKLHPPLRPDGT